MKNSPKNFYNVVDKKKLGIDEAVAVAGDVEQLKTTVGDSSSGLVKQVNDLQTTVDNIDYDISRKADIDGTYPDMTVGNADQLNSTQIITDKVPYVFRTSGGSNDIGNRENDKLVGGTIVFNQLSEKGPSEFTINGVTVTPNSDGSVTLNDEATTSGSLGSGCFKQISAIEDHKYLIIPYGLVEGLSVYSNIDSSATYSAPAIVNASSTANKDCTLRAAQGTVFDNNKVYLSTIDLTLMLGSDIADHIYSIERDTAGTGLSLIRALFPNNYYEYNPGQLMSVKATAHEMVGFNQWDEEWELGAISATTGQNTSSDSRIRSKNYIRIFPQTQYYFKSSTSFRVFYYTATKEFISAPGTTTGNYLFTTPAGAYYMRFILVTDTFTQNDVCINLSWTGYRNGEYEPYVKYSYVLDDDLELRGIAKVDDNGNIYYDGDTYSSDGTVIRNYEIRAYASGDESLPNAITDGTNTVVKLDTPVEESADPFQDPQWVDDFGTEEYVDTRAIPVPVGHITQYPANLRDKLQHLPSPTGVNGTYLIKEEDEVMTLVPDQIPSLPTVDGTYVLTCTVSDGTATLSWTSNA